MVQNFRTANISQSNHERAKSKVRQLGSTNQSLSHQGQILQALDTLGAKLVRSEGERETMRKLLNEALDMQERLENQLERSQMNIFQRLDSVENQNDGLSIEDKEFIENQKKITIENEAIFDDQRKRQLRAEDKLRDSQQTIQKLQRRLDTQDQKRVKLQRRIERVENIAADAQNALEAKAMVLLTDQSETARLLQNRMTEQTKQLADYMNQPANDPKNIKQVNSDSRQWWKTSTSALTIIAAVALGWAIAIGLQPSEKAFVVLDDGQLAQIDLGDGTAKPITFNRKAQSLNAETPSLQTIADEIAFLETNWITNDIIEQAVNEANENNITDYDVLKTVTEAEITMDRDLSLPEKIMELETKSFDGIAEAQHDLAALYTAGEAGVIQNYERATFWFKMAAHQGIANAAYNLGVLNQQGLGGSQDLQRALDWYRRAAQLGHPEAQYNLGIAYIEGVGTRYNPSMAAAFFQQAAFAGIVEAAYNLGLILENGLLGEVRLDDALKWYRAAADNGNSDAQQALLALSQAMDIEVEGAGLLENGESLLKMGFDESDMFRSEIEEDITLGALLPTKEQILIAQVQEQLRKKRLYNGPQDGIVGAGTVKAIRTYQRQQNKPVTGKITEDLLTFMLQQGTH